MLDLDKLTPEQYRARYETLQATARARASRLPEKTAAVPIASECVVGRETIPPGWYVAFRLKRGEALHIGNPAATPGASLLLWNADDTSERYNAGDTVKLQWTTKLGAGRVLFSDMGRVLASVVADSGAGSDPILGPSTPVTAKGARNGRDNLRRAAAKFGLGRRDVGPSLTLFSRVRVDADGRFRWTGAPPEESFVDLRAEMNLLVALSNTPHPLATPNEATGPLAVTLYRAPAPAGDDLCRHFTDEAIRGFENTDPLFVGGPQ